MFPIRRLHQKPSNSKKKRKNLLSSRKSSKELEIDFFDLYIHLTPYNCINASISAISSSKS